MVAGWSSGSHVRAYRLTGRMLVHMASVFGSHTLWSFLQNLRMQVQQCVRPFFVQRCFVHHVSRLPFSSFLTAYRLRSASIWAMPGSLYALGVVVIPLSHPESSMYAATLFITCLGLSMMFVFGLVMLSQSLPPEMAHVSSDARSLWLRHDGRESYFHDAIQNESICTASCGPDFSLHHVSYLASC